MKPLRVILPEGTMLSPRYPAAVIAGNVETSQAVTQMPTSVSPRSTSSFACAASR